MRLGLELELSGFALRLAVQTEDGGVEDYGATAARARHDWFADVVACDQADIEGRAIAHAFSAGIVKQFPDQFE